MPGDQPEAPRKKKTRKRSGHRDVELFQRTLGFAANAGYAAEHEQSDRNHGNLVVLGDRAVRHFVKYQGTEKQRAGHQSQAPQPGSGNVELQGVELGNKGEGDEPENYEPTGVQEDRYPIDSPDLDSFFAYCGRVSSASV